MSVVLNFSGIYESQNFWKDSGLKFADCSDIRGTDCYLDDEAAQILQARLKEFPVRGVHFIDSGNTHYMSKLWTDRLCDRWTLWVFDHHSDMQPPMFNGVLSCGSWIKEVFDKNPFLENAVLIGVSEKSAEEIDPKYLPRIRLISESECAEISPERFEFADELFRFPAYVSIDKDVLSETALKTNWDSGSLSPQALFALAQKISSRASLLGVDICGEPSPSAAPENIRQSNLINAELLRIFAPKF